MCTRAVRVCRRDACGYAHVLARRDCGSATAAATPTAMAHWLPPEAGEVAGEDVTFTAKRGVTGVHMDAERAPMQTRDPAWIEPS